MLEFDTKSRVFNLIYRSVCAGYDFAKFESLNCGTNTNLENLAKDVFENYTEEERKAVSSYLDDIKNEVTEKHEAEAEQPDKPEVIEESVKGEKTESEPISEKEIEPESEPKPEPVSPEPEKIEVKEPEQVEAPQSYEEPEEENSFEFAEQKEEQISPEKVKEEVQTYLEENKTPEEPIKPELESVAENEPEMYYEMDSNFDFDNADDIPVMEETEPVESIPEHSINKNTSKEELRAFLDKKFENYKSNKEIDEKTVPETASVKPESVKEDAEQSKLVITPFGIQNPVEQPKPVAEKVEPNKEVTPAPETFAVEKDDTYDSISVPEEKPVSIEDMDTMFELTGTISHIIDSIKKDNQVSKYATKYAVMPTDCVYLSTNPGNKHIAIILRLVDKETKEVTYKYVVYELALNNGKGKIYNVTSDYEAKLPSLNFLEGTKAQWNNEKQERYDKELSEIFNAYIKDAFVPEVRKSYMSWMRECMTYRPVQMANIIQYFIRSF